MHLLLLDLKYGEKLPYFKNNEKKKKAPKRYISQD